MSDVQRVPVELWVRQHETLREPSEAEVVEWLLQPDRLHETIPMLMRRLVDLAEIRISFQDERISYVEAQIDADYFEDVSDE